MEIKQKKNGVSESGDPIVDGVVKAKAFVQRNGTFMTVCAVALAVAVGGMFAYHRSKEGNIRKAQEIFGVGVLDYEAENVDAALSAFRKVAENHRGTPTAAQSAFLLGSIHLERGEPDQAVAWFETALSGSGGRFVKGQALEGLATAYEEKGDNAAAVRYLERALRDQNVAHRHAAVRWKLALLNKDGNAAAAAAFCKELVADTSAVSYHQKAGNLLAVLTSGTSGN